MRYMVLWKPAAERALATAWMEARDRSAVTDAAHQIDEVLQSFRDFIPSLADDAEETSSTELTRILIVGPLAVVYEIVEQDRTIWVLNLITVPPFQKKS